MIKTQRAKRTFSPEFKLEVIEQVTTYQCDVQEIAQELELHPLGNGTDFIKKKFKALRQ